MPKRHSILGSRKFVKTAPEYLAQYSSQHRNKVNQRIHLVCVPLIFWSILAMLWSIPIPFTSGGVNLATLMLLPALVFYIYLGWRYAIKMAMLWVIACGINYGLEFAEAPLALLGGIVFVVAWLGQFYGHKVEGHRPAFFVDLFFLLIGPLWTLEHIAKSK
jgi:uncharacterized membrane protein YGL010W